MLNLDHKAIIKFYRQERLSAAAIADRLKCSPDTIYTILKGYGVGRDNPGGSPATPDDKVAEVIRRYKEEKQGGTTIAKDLGISKKTVYNILGRAGLGTRPTSDRKGDSYAVARGILDGITPTGFRRGGSRDASQSINSTAFIELTAEASYWAGYLMCDGHIAGNGDDKSMRLFLRQSLKHIDHLESFKDFIGTSNAIQTGTHLDPAGVEQEHCCLTITNNPMCERLQRMGMIGLKPERKATDDRLLRNPHFWRGCVDADGTLILPDKLRLSGHVPLLDQWQGLCVDVTKGAPPHRHEQPGCFVDSLSGERSRLMAAWLYLETPGQCLPRKLERARQMQRPEA